MEAKKISFGSKTKKVEKPMVEEKDNLKCSEEKAIEVIEGETVEEDKPLVIPMKPNTTITAEKLKEIAKKVEASLEEPDQNEIRTELIEKPPENLTLDELAVQELLEDAKKHVKVEKPEITVPIPAKPILEGENESTLDDYEAVPVQDGLAMFRGMGGTRGSEHGPSQDPLQAARASRKLAQRRIAQLPACAKKELLDKQREAQLERMLLPNAPPRKRQRKNQSPQRKPLIMVSTERVTRPTCQADVQAEAGSSRLKTDLPSELEVCSDVEADSLSPRPSTIHENDDNFGQTVTVCLSGVIDSDDDDDDDDREFQNVYCPQPRNATDEPACESDMTALQTSVLRAEDRLNDQALRDIAPRDEDIYHFNWTNDRDTFFGERETFSETTGPTFDVTETTGVLDIFDKMIDVDFIDGLCRETNRYANQKISLLREQKKLTPGSRFNRWVPTDRNEMVTFLAIHILMGLYPMPEERAYFGYNGFGTLKFFGRIMSYNRYLLLKTFLHFVDNDSLQDTTRLRKVRPVIDYFNDKFTSLYMPAQEIAIDESLLKWCGRLSFTQKISSKAAQVGVKTYELCESSTGYLWRFAVYAGKDKPTTDRPDDGADTLGEPNRDGDRVGEPDATEADGTGADRTGPDGTGANDTVTGSNIDRPSNATAKIVYELVEPLLHRGHTITMDNFYNSPLLLRCLKRQKTDCFGTLRLNREFVPDSIKTLNKTDLRQGEVVATYCSDLAILVWRDSNLVSLISTYHNLQIGTSDKYDKLTYKPKVVLDYNTTMGGIDRKDQFLAAQPMERVRNRVWYKKLFRRMYNTAIFNCFVIYRSRRRNDKVEHRSFRVMLAEELLKRHRQIDLTKERRVINYRKCVTGPVKGTTTTRAPPGNGDWLYVEHNHFPIRTGSYATKCGLCKSRTSWKCEQCNVNLCIEICFKNYHKRR